MGCNKAPGAQDILVLDPQDASAQAQAAFFFFWLLEG